MQTLTSIAPVPSSARWLSGHSPVPGLLFTATIAGAAFGLRNLAGITAVSPLIIAIGLGLAFHNTVGTPAAFTPGVAFSLRRVLRFAVVLLGLQLSLSQVAAVGSAGIGVIAATLAATFLFTLWLGRMLGVDRKLTELIAAGSSICGASAVVATNTVTRAPDEDVAYAVACVTVFGSASMLLYPALEGFLQLTPHAFGLWAGASIHEVAQVVAAAFQNGPDAGNFGTIAKLSRVMLLAPMILTLGCIGANQLRVRRSEPLHRPSVPVPWFVLGFVAMMLFNSLDPIPPLEKVYLVQATTFLLTVALAAMGLQTDIRKLRAKGWKPLFVGAGAWLFISAFSLALVELIYA
jgi:uncharacterized integral membrane protein (TIGR00698 family)